MSTKIESFKNFKACCENAPAGTYMKAKDLNDTIGETMDSFMQSIRDDKWKANNCDLAYTLESEIYAYVKASNPESDIFSIAEGFGAAMETEARERVIAGAEKDRDCLRRLNLNHTEE